MNKVLIALVIVLAAALAFAFFTRPEPGGEPVGGVGTDEYNHIFFNNGLYGSKFTQGGSILRFTATTTQDGRTLTEAELAANSIIEIVSTSSPLLTLTLPATSTMKSLLPKVGDIREWIIDNQHAAATTTTITAGTGIDLIAVTANDDVIDGVEKARLTCWRKFNTDVGCIVSELLNAD